MAGKVTLEAGTAPLVPSGSSPWAWPRLTRGAAVGVGAGLCSLPVVKVSGVWGEIPLCAERRSRRDASCPELMGPARSRRVLPCHNLVWLRDSDLGFERRLCRAVPIPRCARWAVFIKSNAQRD